MFAEGKKSRFLRGKGEGREVVVRSKRSEGGLINPNQRKRNTYTQDSCLIKLITSDR